MAANGQAKEAQSSPNNSAPQSVASAVTLATIAKGPRPNFGFIRLDISNSVLPLEKLTPTPSSKDGLSDETEMQIRSLGCELIQLAGKLLRLPQVIII